MRIVSQSTPAATEVGKSAQLNTAEVDKLRKSARDFEAMLLNSLWKEMRPSEDEDSGDGLGSGMNGQLQELAFQSVANQAAASGGLGIGRLILHSMGVPESPTGHVPPEVERYRSFADGKSMQSSSLSASSGLVGPK